MSAPGGSAAINGILYQILATFSQIAKIHFQDSDVQAQNLVSVRVELEPVGGGGDAQFHFKDQRIVEQYKSKSGNGTWSVQEIIHKVLIDLIKAVPCVITDDHSVYRFVTNGREGKLQHFKKFLKIMKTTPIPDSPPIELLDDKYKYPILPGKQLSYVDFFQQIASVLNKEKENDLHHYRRVWHLLAHFEIHSQKAGEDYEQQIDQRLEAVVNFKSDIPAKRRELCMFLLEFAAANQTITPPQLFQKAGIDNTPLNNLSTLELGLKKQVNEWCKNREYIADMDVRPVPTWSTDNQIIVIAGDSGRGKTWQLAKIAISTFQNGGVAAIIDSQQNAGVDCQKLSNVVFQEGYERDDSVPLNRLAAKMKEVVPSLSSQWLTACVDDVQNAEEAVRLVRESWEIWGIRLAISTSKRIGRILKLKCPAQVSLYEIDDFTHRETNEYLYRNGLEWGEVPQDIRETLRIPILADIYCRLTRDDCWIPRTEYELYEQYWKRVAEDPGQIAYPNDREVILTLAGRLLSDGVRYPWTPEMYCEVGLNDERLGRLEKIGLLRKHDRGEVEIWHDRLLNWAVAEWMIDQRRRNKLDVDNLSQILSSMLFSRDLFNGKMLGYVPMDYLWLTCDPECNLEGDVGHLLEVLCEQDNSYVLPTLFPSLGSRIVPFLIQHLELNADDQHIILKFTESFKKLGEYAPSDVSGAAIHFLRSGKEYLVELGLKILREYPNVEILDNLWQLNVISYHNMQISSSERPVNAFHRHDLTFNALRATVHHAPDWIEKKLRQIDPAQEPASELGWLLFNLEQSVGNRIWKKNKSRFFKFVPENKRRVLAQCIGKFRDKEELDTLKTWAETITKNDLLGPAAFSALCRLNVSAALNLFFKMDISDLYFTRNWWMPELFFREAAKARQALLDRAKGEEKGHLFLGDIYSGRENQIDHESFSFFLDELERELRSHSSEELSSDPIWLSRCLSFLYGIHRPDLLKILSTRAGSSLDTMLGEVAVSRLGRDSDIQDNTLVSIRGVLRKIAGAGLTCLTNEELTSDVSYDRTSGMTDAVVCPNDHTIELLRSLASNGELAGTSNVYYEQGLALKSLAILDDHPTVARGVLRIGTHCQWNVFSVWKPGEQIDLEEVRKHLKNAAEGKNEEDLHNALLLARQTHNAEIIQDIENLKSQISPASQTAYFVAITLHTLGDKSEDFVTFLSELLKTSDRNQKIALRILLNLSLNNSLQTLVSYFLKVGGKHKNNEHVILDTALRLYEKRDYKDVMRPILSKWAKEGTSSFFGGKRWLEILPELDIPDAHDILLEKAFDTNTFTPINVVYAIKGLYRLDPESSVSAAKKALNQLKLNGERIQTIVVCLKEE